MSKRGGSQDNPAVEGFRGCMKTEAVCPEHRERFTCRQVMDRVDMCMHWYNYQRIRQSPEWNSSIHHRMEQGLAVSTISKKTPAAPYHFGPSEVAQIRTMPYFFAVILVFSNDKHPHDNNWSVFTPPLTPRMVKGIPSFSSAITIRTIQTDNHVSQITGGLS
jgi:hypothetical protein